MKKKSSRLARLAGWTLMAVLSLTVLPVALLRVVPPPTTAFMLQSPVKPVRYHWVPAEQISRHARRAVVAAEDQKFWTHEGFDLEAIEAARAHNQKSRRKRGASTISQQTAKNLFLWSGGGYFRKGIEAGYTILIETLWSKDRILEVYLNIAEFGPGLYGVEAASQQFFGKPASALNASEAARLAAVLPSPRRWKVTQPGPYVQSRGAWILRQMGRREGAVSTEPEPEMPEELLRAMEAEEAGRDAMQIVPTEAPLPPVEAQEIELAPPDDSAQHEVAPEPVAPAPIPDDPPTAPAPVAEPPP